MSNELLESKLSSNNYESLYLIVNTEEKTISIRYEDEFLLQTWDGSDGVSCHGKEIELVLKIFEMLGYIIKPNGDKQYSLDEYGDPVYELIR